MKPLSKVCAFVSLLPLLVGPPASAAPEMTVTTFAGGPQPGIRDGLGTAARFHSPRDFAVGRDRSVYVADTGNHTIRKVFPDGRVTTLAGLAAQEGAADGVGGRARFRSPSGLAVTADDAVFVADRDNHTIRRISRFGEVTTWAGGERGEADGPGTAARFHGPSSLALAPDGSLYVGEDGGRIRRIAPDRMVTTIPRRGSEGRGTVLRMVFDRDGSLVFSQLDGDVFRLLPDGSAERIVDSAVHCGGYPCAGSWFDVARGLAFDDTGGILVASGRYVFRFEPGVRNPTDGFGWNPEHDPGIRDGYDGTFGSLGALHRFPDGRMLVLEREGAIREIAPDGRISTFAGSAAEEIRRDGEAANARFEWAGSLAVRADGGLVVSDSGDLRSVAPNGRVTTLVRDMGWASALAVTLDGIFVARARDIVRVVGSRIERWAGDPERAGSVDGDLLAARFDEISGIAANAAGELFVSDRGAGTIRRIFGGRVTTLAGKAHDRRFVDGPRQLARFEDPYSIALLPDGSATVSDRSRIRRIAPDGSVTTLAGGGHGYVDGPAATAQFTTYFEVATDRVGNVFALEWATAALRRLGTDGIVTTVAGGRLARELEPRDWLRWFGGIDGTGAAAAFHRPLGLAIDDRGRVFAADFTAIRLAEYALPDRAVAEPACGTGLVRLDVAEPSGGGTSWRFTRLPSTSNARLDSPDSASPTFEADVDDLFEIEADTSTGVERSITRILRGPEVKVLVRVDGPGSVCLGGSATFVATISGGTSGLLRWFRNGREIPGVTGAVLRVDEVLPGDEFSAAAETHCGFALSGPVPIELESEPPSVVPLPPIAEVELGQPFAVTAEVSGGRNTFPITEWRHTNSARVRPGPTLSFDSVTPEAAGRWLFEAENACGSAFTSVILVVKP